MRVLIKLTPVVVYGGLGWDVIDLFPSRFIIQVVELNGQDSAREAGGREEPYQSLRRTIRVGHLVSSERARAVSGF